MQNPKLLLQQTSSLNMELIDNLLENLSANHHEIMALSNDSFTDHQRQTQLPMNFIHDNIHQSFSDPSSDHLNHHEALLAHSTPLAADFGQEAEKGKAIGGRKRKRSNGDKYGEKPREVIHVRAKRGQATDSHSLAERVRREKINERLRCLQNLVPGCYKTMGMAVMLDVVISYVQSLQNQIEFLSMKLSAASVYYDFNSPGMDPVDTMQQQGTTNGYNEVQEMVRSEGYGGLSNYNSNNNDNNSTWPI